MAGVPQFVPAGEPVLGWSLLLSGIDVAVAMLWFAGLISVASAALAAAQARRRTVVAAGGRGVAGGRRAHRRVHRLTTYLAPRYGL